MSQIGDRLGISRHRVGRLLREAIETGVVKIEIQSSFSKCMEIEQALENAFGLKASLVVEVNPDLSPDDIKLDDLQSGCRVPPGTDKGASHDWGRLGHYYVRAY